MRPMALGRLGSISMPGKRISAGYSVVSCADPGGGRAPVAEVASRRSTRGKAQYGDPQGRRVLQDVKRQWLSGGLSEFPTDPGASHRRLLYLVADTSSSYRKATRNTIRANIEFGRRQAVTFVHNSCFQVVEHWIATDGNRCMHPGQRRWILCSLCLVSLDWRRSGWDKQQPWKSLIALEGPRFRVTPRGKQPAFCSRKLRSATGAFAVRVAGAWQPVGAGRCFVTELPG